MTQREDEICVELCRLSYRKLRRGVTEDNYRWKMALRRNRIPKLGMRLVDALWVDDAELMIAADDERRQLYCVWRGSETGYDFLRDVSIRQTEFGKGAKAHNGFVRSVRSLGARSMDTVASFLAEGYTVTMTGHSKGGAEAVLHAAWSALAGNLVDRVVTFGAPRCCNAKLKRYIESHTGQIHRYWCGADWVPVPLWSRFRHVGQLFYVDYNYVTHQSPSATWVLWAWLQARRIQSCSAWHSLTNYRKALRRSNETE